jgi:tetratricopeptide (TPR) repeat protein
MKYLIVLYFLFSISSAVHAQNIFLVYKIYGKAFYNSPKGKVKVIIGNTYNESDSIFLEAKSKITFLCNNYVPFVVEKEGVVELKKIANNCIKSSQNKDLAFFKFVWEQFSHPHLDPKKNRKKYFHNLGAPIRNTHKDVDIEEYYSDYSIVEGSKIKLKWDIKLPKKFYKTGNYKFILMNRSSASKSINQFSIYNSGSFDFSNNDDNVIYPAIFDWGITYDSILSRERSNAITIYSRSQFDSIVKNIDSSIETNIGAAEKNFRTGVALESLHFYREAFIYYQKALNLEPDNEMYKKNIEILKSYYQF